MLGEALCRIKISVKLIKIDKHCSQDIFLLPKFSVQFCDFRLINIHQKFGGTHNFRQNSSTNSFTKKTVEMQSIQTSLPRSALVRQIPLLLDELKWQMLFQLTSTITLISI